MAAIRLNGIDDELGVVDAYIPDSFFDDQMIDPASEVKGWIDETPVPLEGSDPNYYYKNWGSVNGIDFGDSDADTDNAHHFGIFNDNWSEHDFAFGAIPEPSRALLVLIGLLTIPLTRRR